MKILHSSNGLEKSLVFQLILFIDITSFETYNRSKLVLIQSIPKHSTYKISVFMIDYS